MTEPETSTSNLILKISITACAALPFQNPNFSRVTPPCLSPQTLAVALPAADGAQQWRLRSGTACRDFQNVVPGCGQRLAIGGLGPLGWVGGGLAGMGWKGDCSY